MGFIVRDLFSGGGAVSQPVIFFIWRCGGVYYKTEHLWHSQSKALAAENSQWHFTSLIRKKQPFEYESGWYSWPFSLRSEGLSLKCSLPASGDVQRAELFLKTGLERTPLLRVLVWDQELALWRERSWEFTQPASEITREGSQVGTCTFYLARLCPVPGHPAAQASEGRKDDGWRRPARACVHVPYPTTEPQGRTCPSARQVTIAHSSFPSQCASCWHFVVGNVSSSGRVWELMLLPACFANGLKSL